MKVEYYKEYSRILDKDMEFKVFGHSGKPCIAFPTLNGRFFDYEDRGIIDSMSWYIEQGKIQVFCVDSLDYESWTANWKNPRDRMEAQERYFKYIIEEIVPRVYEINDTQIDGIMTYGCAMGAFHAVNFVLRKPDIFHSSYFVKEYADELTFLNSPIDSLANMPIIHRFVELYRKARIIICVGQGEWEHDCLDDTRALDFHMKRLCIPAWFDYWGYDKNHDWPSWQEQTPHFLYHILD